MKKNMEDALRRAMSQLPGPDFERVAGTPVTPMTVHDSVTQPRPIRRRRWPVLVLILLAALIAGWVWYLYCGQVYSVVDLEAGAEFSIELNRGDRVLAVVPGNRAAEELLEGRSYRDWTLAAAGGALLEELLSKGYVETFTDVNVAVSSKEIDRARNLREEVEELLLSAPSYPVPVPSYSPAPLPSATPLASEKPVPDVPGHHGYGAQKHLEDD